MEVENIDTLNSNLQEEVSPLQENEYSTNTESVSDVFINYDELDASQRKEIEDTIFNKDAGVFDDTQSEDYIYNGYGQNQYQSRQDNEEDSIKSFLSVVFDIDIDIISNLDIYDVKETRKFIYLHLKDWYYPSKEVEAFAEFVENGGTIQEFAAALAPVDFSQLSDEDAIRMYYANRMDSEALEEYISTLKNAGKLEKRAKEIKKEVGVVELSSDEILSKQREMKQRQRQWLNNLKNAVSEIIYKLGLKFKSSDEKEEFIDLITEPKYHYNENGQLEFIGSEYAYILNADLAALVISAYYLYNYDTEKKKQKAITETIDNIKRNLIQNRNLGIANFGL